MGVGVAADPVVRFVQRHLMRVAEDVGGGQSRHSGSHYGRPPPFPCHSGSLRCLRLVGALLKRASAGIRGRRPGGLVDHRICSERVIEEPGTNPPTAPAPNPPCQNRPSSHDTSDPGETP
ncbi:hypothetical protein GCM10010253_50770 [Streptomyces badius]|uniref:Uncharacterized protein n=1 Tax=Streptomyces badius TaxID=1941 RepID=A0ABQ2TGR8_STRBA|nr:hypothetical protein GCM10010253_50770 [Streptomyces badius]